MPSFTTIFRAIVMLAVGAIVVKGWQLFGPPPEQVKSAVVSAIETAEAMWKGAQSGGDTAAAAAASPSAAPPFAAAGQPASGSPTSPQAPALVQAPSNATNGPIDSAPIASVPASPQLIAAPAEQPPTGSVGSDDRMTALMSRLKQLSVAQEKLAPWGSSGHLYRFTCQAAINDSPELTRHFESVAEQPTTAVEQVVAKVEAWRTAQRGDAVPRF